MTQQTKYLAFVKLNKTPAKAFTSPAEKKIRTKRSFVKELNE